MTNPTPHKKIKALTKALTAQHSHARKKSTNVVVTAKSRDNLEKVTNNNYDKTKLEIGGVATGTSK